jgi:hypothetical protein
MFDIGLAPDTPLHNEHTKHLPIQKAFTHKGIILTGNGTYAIESAAYQSQSPFTGVTSNGPHQERYCG